MERVTVAVGVVFEELFIGEVCLLVRFGPHSVGSGP